MEINGWNRSSLLGLEDLSRAEINTIFELADSYKNEMARGGLSGVDQYILNRYK